MTSVVTAWQLRLGRLGWKGWAALAAGYWGAYALWLSLRPDGEVLHSLVSHVAVLPPGALAAWAALSLQRLPRGMLAQPLKRLWAFLGLAVCLWMTGGVIWAAYRLATNARPPLPSIGDPLYMAGHLLALTALLSFPSFPRGALGRFRIWLDLAIISGVSTALGWLLLLQPIFTGLAVRPAETLWLAIYPILDLIILLVLSNVALILEPGELRSGLGLAGLGLVAMVVADLAYTYLGLRGQFDNDELFDLGRMACFALIGLAALRQRRAVSGAASPRPRWRWLRRLQSSLPIAAAIALTWYTFADWQADGQVSLLALGINALVGVALVARQGVVGGEIELGQYAQLVDSAADPAFICDRRGQLQLVNPALVAALGGQRAAEFLGQSVLSLIVPETLPPELRVPPRGISTSVLEAGWSGEVSFRRAEGAEFPVYLSLRPVITDMGARPALAGTAHDLSVQKRQQAALVQAYEAAAAARAALEELNTQLESKVDEKTRDLSEAYQQLAAQNEALKTLDRLKSEFVSLVSHELRAPLTNISGGIELVLALSADLGPRTRDHLALVQTEIHRLNRFVETILDLSALEAGRLPVSVAPLPLARIVEGLRAHFAAAPGGERLRTQLPAALPMVLADERALASVLFHLADNALKYAPEGDVTVAAERLSGAVRVSVSDHGPGVPPELREAIFEQFRRLNAADSQAVYGHGLGLYMVRRLLQALNSDIAVGDAPGGGARFTFELPIAKDDE